MIVTNNHGVPGFVHNYVKNNLWKPRLDYIRVSELINQPQIRRLKLERWDDCEIDVRGEVAALLGTGIHFLLKDILQGDDIFSQYLASWPEQTLELDMNGIVLKGTIDLYMASMEGVWAIIDHKTTGVDALKYDHLSWELQTNVYAFLLREYGRKVDRINVYIYLRDWNIGKANNPSYPQSPILKVPINLWKPEVVEEYVLKRLALHKSFMEMPYEEFCNIGNMCTDSERWHKPDIYVCKKPESSRARANTKFGSYEEARANLKPGEIVEHRPGLDTYCESFCDAKKICPYKNGVIRNEANIAY